METFVRKTKALGKASEVQVFVILCIDAQRALDEGTLVGNAYLMDNSVGSTGQGSLELSTVIKQGQVVNILIYSINQDQNIDGKYPPLGLIDYISFVSPEPVKWEDDGVPMETTTYDLRTVFDDFHRYGGADRIRNPKDPVYFYWSGMVRRDLTPGIYKYDMVIQLSTEDSFKKTYLNITGPSFNVISVIPEADLEIPAENPGAVEKATGKSAASGAKSKAKS